MSKGIPITVSSVLQFTVCVLIGLMIFPFALAALTARWSWNTFGDVWRDA